MARFCFLPPTKRPTTAREQATKSRTRTSSSSMSDGMLKRLEPVFIPKKRLYKRGASGNNKTEATESPKREKHEEKKSNSEKQTPKKIPPTIKSQLPQRKSIRRELFPQNSKKQENQEVKNVLEIVDEQSKESNVKEKQFIFPSGTQSQQKSSSNITKHQDDEVTKKDAGFKKPKPKISKKRKQEKRLINKSVLEIIRKTHESIQKIRNQAKSDNTITDESNKSIPENVHDQLRKTKTSLNVQVSICIPNAGIQKSQCTVMQTGSVEEEDIGYKHDKIKSYQDIQALL